MNMLNILIPTIPSRKNRLNILRGKILRQIKACEDQWGKKLGFSVITVCNKPYLDGGPSIGEARQNLLDLATAEYCCFLDDDDDIAPNYITLIYQALEKKPDVVTFMQVAYFDNMIGLVNMSINNQENEQLKGNGITQRQAWHINPIKTAFAKFGEFPKENYGEDDSYMQKVRGFLKTEIHYDTILHIYKHSTQTSEADKIANNVQPE